MAVIFETMAGICCYCGEETSPCGTGIYFDNLGIMYKGTYDVHYSKHNNNITTTFNWWTGGGNINIYNSLTTHSP